jgi:hypothetical protein
MSVATSTEHAQRAGRDGHSGGPFGSAQDRRLCHSSNPRSPRRELASWVIPAALFAGTLAVYLRTLRPSFDWLDNSELITAAYHLGIGHNPGYPTFMLLGHLFSWLPVGSVAYRLNLMSAMLGAVAVVPLFLVCVRATGNRVASALTAATLAFSCTFWDATTEADVFTLHACFMLGIILVLVRWRQEKKERDLYLAWLLVGVSLGNHALTALMIPAVIALMLMDGGGRSLRPGNLWRCAAALVGGLALYIYVPLRAMANPPPEVNNPHSLRQFWQLLSAPAYHEFMFHMSATEVGLRALGFARHTVRELGPLGIAAALLGIILAARKDAKLATALLLILGADVLYAINYNIFDIYMYFLPAYLVLGVFMALGLERALAWGEKGLARLQRGVEGFLTGPRRIAVVALLLTYLPVWAFSANFTLVDASHDYAAEDFARNAYEVAEPGAVIIGDWWSIAPLGYLKYVEGLRPDVTLSVALSCPDPAAVRRVLRRDFLATFPAAYVVEHQTSWIREFKARYAWTQVGDLVRLYPNGKPRLRARPSDAAPACRFGDNLGLIGSVCEPQAAHQGRILAITHRWKKLACHMSGGLARRASAGLAPIGDDAETLTSIQGACGCIWRARSDLANGFYTGDSWLPGEVAEERHVAFIPSDAPPGEYCVTLRARNKSTHHSLSAHGTGATEHGQEAVVASIRIVARRSERPIPSFAPRHW